MKTYWNGQPCQARRVRVRVGDHGRVPHPWYAELVGQERNAVEITVEDGQRFYIDDAHGLGWAKVTVHLGSPQTGHGGLAVDEVLGERERVAVVLCQDCRRHVIPEDGRCGACGHSWTAARDVEEPV